MKLERCLTLRERVLKPGLEWQVGLTGWHVLKIIEGSGYLLQGDGPRELTPGTVVMTFRGHEVRLRASTLSILRIREFSLRPKLLADLLVPHEYEFLANLDHQSPNGLRVYGADSPESADFPDQGDLDPARSGFLERSALLNYVATLLDGDITAHHRRSSQSKHRRLASVINQLTRMELFQYSARQLAKECGCSPRHFSRLYRQEYGVSFRDGVMTARLDLAKKLLQTSEEKIIDVALECGFQNLGLFNMVFKKYCGVTPSDWRRQKAAKSTVRTNRKAPALAMAVVLLMGGLRGLAATNAPAPTTNAPAPTTNAPAPTTNAPASATNASMPVATAKASAAQTTIPVKAYEVEGNTLLKPEDMQKALSVFTGDAVSFAQIELARQTLAMLYRKKGWVTVYVYVPKQRPTNQVVKIGVLEGKLAAISVVGNRYFSSNNVMRALPSLRTNILLNSFWLSPELDLANNHPDRQIYPEQLGGADTGQTALVLRVKDRIPLHARVEINNQATPGTPDIRINSSLAYNNLWQRDHSLGVQYGFTPEEYKGTARNSYDLPLISYYSAYYRIPLGRPEVMVDRMQENPAAFGYNEATRQFNAPAGTGRPQLTFYASRFTMDTGVKYTEKSLITSTATTDLYSQDAGQDITLNESIGFRFVWPVISTARTLASVSLGADYKHYYANSYNTNMFYSHSEIPGESADEAPVIYEDVLASSSTRQQKLEYVPLTLRWDWSRTDKVGTTTFGAGVNANVNYWISDRTNFVAMTGSTNGDGLYAIVSGDVSRVQNLGAGFTLLAKASGQWANQPLISNEQFGLGGVQGLRGYMEGTCYGDDGWKATFEPRTPLVNLGYVDERWAMRARLSVFSDYGQVLYKSENKRNVDLWSTGASLSVLMGSTLDMRLTVAWPLLEVGKTLVGQGRVHFGVSAQF